MVKAVLAVGLYPNLAYIQFEKIMTRTENRVTMHGCSCLAKYAEDKRRSVFHNWLLFEELSKTGSHCCIKCATVISPLVVSNRIFKECYPNLNENRHRLLIYIREL